MNLDVHGLIFADMHLVECVQECNLVYIYISLHKAVIDQDQNLVMSLQFHQ